MSNSPGWKPTRLANLRDPIEAAFGRYGHFVHRQPWRIVALMALLVTALFSQLHRIEIDTSTEGFLRKDDPIRVTYDAFRDRYGRDQVLVVGIRAPTVFDLELLSRLRALHEDIEERVPYLDDVQSLVNARETLGEADQLIVRDLMEEWPETEADLASLRERVRANPLYVDQLVSRNERLATILIRTNAYSSQGQDLDALEGFDDEAAEPVHLEYLTGEENTEVVLALEEVVREHEHEGLELMVAGTPLMTDRIMRDMLQDMAFFTAMSLATIAFFLAILFRRVAAIILPLLVSGLAMLCTLAIMAMIGIPITTTSQIMPSFLLAVGVGSSVHILAIFYQATGRGESREEALAFALRHSGLAVVMTSLTTAGGMLSFISAEIAPVMELGIITPLGIMAALLFSLVLLPALIAVFPAPRPAARKRDHVPWTRQVLVTIGDASTRHAPFVIAVWAVLVAFAILGALQLKFSHYPLEWFEEDDPFRVATNILNDELGGSMYVEGVVETGTVDSMKKPELLDLLDSMVDFASTLHDGDLFVGKTISLVDVVKETHQALNENRPEFYAIPSNPELLSQELLLFENSGSDDLEDLVDSQFSQARFTMKMPMADAIHYTTFLERLAVGFEEILGESATLTITGEGRMVVRLVDALTYSLARTYVLAFAIITPLMVLLLGNVRLGLLSMIPNLAPIALTVGLMGWLGIPMEIFTLLIGSIALGLAVDDTIHFMHNFRRYYERSGDAPWAVRETLSTTGQALLFTSIVLSSGFFIYMQASLRSLFHFGLLTGLTIIFAFLADLILAPALMALVAHRVAPVRNASAPLSQGAEGAETVR